MNALQKTALFLFTSATMAACSSSTTKDFSFNANDATFDINTKTGVCFGAYGIDKPGFGNSGGVVTCVPCTEEVLKLVDQDHLEKVRKNNITPVNFAGPR